MGTAGYDYSLVYKPLRDNNADGLSRLPLEGNSGSQLLYEDELGWANLNVMESDSVDIIMCWMAAFCGVVELSFLQRVGVESLSNLTNAIWVSTK